MKWIEAVAANQWRLILSDTYVLVYLTLEERQSNQFKGRCGAIQMYYLNTFNVNISLKYSFTRFLQENKNWILLSFS